MRNDTVVWPVLMELHQCLCDEIVAAELPGVCYCDLLPGENVAMEYCGPSCEDMDCGNGQAWVRLVESYPSTNFPNPIDFTAQAAVGCDAPLAVTVEMGVARCAPVVSEDRPSSGESPTAGQWRETAQLQFADMSAMRRAVQCCMDEKRAVKKYTLGTYEPFGPEGGCVGGTWTVTFSGGLRP